MSETQQSFRDAHFLSKFFPGESFHMAQQIINSQGIILKLNVPRRRKLGDYRPARQGTPPIITINNNLNPYRFLLTFIHELAHHFTHIKFPQNIPPHGPLWQSEFRKLIDLFLPLNCFPPEITTYLSNSQLKPGASAASEQVLSFALRAYDENLCTVPLEWLPEGSRFKLSNGREYIKLGRRRKHFICRQLNNRKHYIISSLTEVYPVKGSEM